MEAYLETCDALDSRQFRIAIKQLATSIGYGTDRSPFLGQGVEFAQSRAYQWGDPVRSIDWRVTARTGRVHVKEYEAPKRMPCYLLIDTSASMTIGSGRRSKYSLAVHIAGGLAFACLERISPVGVIGVGGSDLRVDPSLSRDQVMQWLVRLRRFRFDERTTLGRRVTELEPQLTSRALIVVLSDLHDPQAIPALKLLAQRHDCVVLRLMDPAERSMRGSGFLRAREAETGRSFVTHGRHRWVDPATAAGALKRAGIDHLRIDTNEPFVHRLRHFFRARGLLDTGGR